MDLKRESRNSEQLYCCFADSVFSFFLSCGLSGGTSGHVAEKIKLHQELTPVTPDFRDLSMTDMHVLAPEVLQIIT